MSRFVETFDQELINLDVVALFRPSQDGRKAEVIGKNGRVLGYCCYGTVRPLVENKVIVPAAVGFTLIECFVEHDTGELVVHRSPVIAWGIDPDPDAECQIAYAFDGNSRGKGKAVLCPDGSVKTGMYGVYPDFDTWLNEEVRPSLGIKEAVEVVS